MNGILPLYKPTGMTSADVGCIMPAEILGIKKMAIPAPLILNVDGVLPLAELVQALKRCRN